MSLAHHFRDVPLAHEMRVHVEQQAPFGLDGGDRVLSAMHHAYSVEGATEREALCRGLEQLREEITPCIRSPRGPRRPPSRKQRRRVCAAIDHFIAEMRERNG